jgi:hypothetical protein
MVGRFFVVLAALVFLSACSGKHYAHYSYVKKKTALPELAIKKSEKKYTDAILMQGHYAYGLMDGTDTITYKQQTFTVQKTQRYAVANKAVIPNKAKVQSKPKEKSEVIDDEPVARKLNDYVGESYLTLLRGILICYIPFVGWVYGIMNIARSIKLAVKAIKEIDNEPDKYYGMGLAMLSILFSSLILASLIFLISIGIAFILTEGSVGYTMFWLLD